MSRFTRFLLDKGHYSSERVKFRAFLPKADNPKKSVFIVEGLTEEGIWECGRWVEEHARNPQTSKVLARGDFRAVDVENAGLALEADTKPHELHWNIVGWPADKEQRTAKAQLLADNCGKPIPRPPGS